MIFTRTNALKGEITVPGDKSISHRSIMFGALAEGTTRVTNFLRGADCLSTIDCFRKLGIDIEDLDSEILIHGKGLHGLTAPSSMLDVGNSGTTTRLISGILAGQRFTTELNGDESIQSRPMKRIMEPLTLMGADITSIRDNGCAPLRIHGQKLHGIAYTSKVASAQVKSCILLAGLYADGTTSVTRTLSVPESHRDHVEHISVLILRVRVLLLQSPPARTCTHRKSIVPGDISSAAYFIAGSFDGSRFRDTDQKCRHQSRPEMDCSGSARIWVPILLCSMKIYGNGEPTADLLVRRR